MLLMHAARVTREPTRLGQKIILAGAMRRATIDYYRWGAMSISKRERWTESDVLALPAGENDSFDRKSGGDFTADRGNFLDFVSKALSAFANSGGGHLILGLHDDAVTFDGLPPTEGRTPTREWLEQKIPNLVAYELQDFRVHEVVPSNPSSIPAGRVAIVIDIGDSALAPHQTTRGPKNYYYRQGGHSVIAPHHYLELLRQRVVGPQLNAELKTITTSGAYRTDEGEIILPLTFPFEIRNDGRIAAYKWYMRPRFVKHEGTKTSEDFTVDSNIPPPAGTRERQGSIDIGDPTILPGVTRDHTIRMGVRLKPEAPDYMPDMFEEVAEVLKCEIAFQIATETSPGEPFTIPLSKYLDADNLCARVCADLGIS